MNDPANPEKINVSPKIVYIVTCIVICGTALLLNFGTLLDSFQKYTNADNKSATESRETFLRERISVYVGGSVLSLVLLLLLGKYLLDSSLRRQKSIALALTNLQEGNSSTLSDSGADPELTTAFNNLANTLTELDRGHRKWVADSSHELRTPIAVLRAQIEAFQDGVHEITPRNLAVLHSEVLALSKLVDDLHWLSKADVGGIKTTAIPVDINQSLQDILESFQEKREARGIKLENLIPPDDKLIASVDASSLRQVFTNLIQNSLRYTDLGGTLRITHAVDDNILSLIFDDTEPGVAEDFLPKIFDRFFRVDASRNRSQGGSGLGLAICMNNMHLLGGKIDAAQSPMGGLRVILTLPLMGQEQ